MCERSAPRGVRLSVRFAERIHRLHDRNRSPVFCGGFGHTADHRDAPQRAHAVLHGDQPGVGRQRGQSVPHRVEPLRASRGDFVFGDIETRREVFPEPDVLFGKYRHDLRAGQRRGERVDRARQYGHAAQKPELLGPCAACAASAAPCYDDDSRAFHRPVVLLFVGCLYGCGQDERIELRDLLLGADFAVEFSRDAVADEFEQRAVLPGDRLGGFRRNLQRVDRRAVLPDAVIEVRAGRCAR